MHANSIHPARQIPLDVLLTGLRENVSAGMIRETSQGDLSIFSYTDRCAYERAWNPFTMVSRGLIIDITKGAVVATPFPKFFNIGENGIPVPDLPFEAFEKVDGSLIVAFYHAGGWRAATRGSFTSSQAVWAQGFLDSMSAVEEAALDVGTTYMLEAVYPANRIVVRYDEEALVLLGGYDADGSELSRADLEHVGRIVGWRCARSVSYGSLDDILTVARALPGTEEGYVLRFQDGTRLKIKGAEYCRLHSVRDRITPLGIWEMLAAGDNLEAARSEIAEELLKDFDEIVAAIRSERDSRIEWIADKAKDLAHLSDRELGIALPTIDPEVRPYLFGFRKRSARFEDMIWRAIRPAGNVLRGYEASFADADFE